MGSRDPKKENSEKKFHFFKSKKIGIFYLIPDTQLFLIEFALFDIPTANRVLMTYLNEKPLKNTLYHYPRSIIMMNFITAVVSKECMKRIAAQSI